MSGTIVAWTGLAAALGCLVWIYAGYPLVLVLRRRVRPRPIRKAPVLPPATVVIPVHDEEGAIDAKIRNTLSLRYPPDRLDVLVVSDGSRDGTEEIVRGYAGAGVRLLSLPRGGKAAALNAGAAHARGEILVFTDVDWHLEPGGLAALVSSFADPRVGGVCGMKARRRSGRRRGEDGAATAAEGEGRYRRFDTWLKELESASGSAFAADGALYAVRRELYVPIEDPAQADDIAVSARVVLQGRRLVFEPRATATDATAGGEAPGPARELRRRMRVANHSVRALLNLGSGLWSCGFYSLQLWSHKLLRHFTPVFLAGLLASSVALAPGRPAFLLAAVLQAELYALGVLGFLLRGTRTGRRPLLGLPYYFCLVMAATSLGLAMVAAGRRIRAWTPGDR